jgi:uncharacterized protein (DUF4415 family)
MKKKNLCDCGHTHDRHPKDGPCMAFAASARECPCMAFALSKKKGAASRLRGKQKAPTKVPLYIRIAPDALDAWRATGKGWQTRLAESIASTAPQGAERT